MQISQFFINGDIKGAITYMREHEEFKDILPAYIAIYEYCEYRTYDVPELLNNILLHYQVYYRDTFYCGLPEAEAAGKLLANLRVLLGIPDAGETLLAERLQAVFEQHGYHALFGKTQGYYGPYIWRETVPTTYRVELPGGTAEYTVNVLGGFIFCGWMDYLTFGRYGTGGWTSPDGAINCIEQAYDFESERFRVSLLKHEAQHATDMKQFPEITPAELEYRAKLVELHYSGSLELLQKLLSEADESNPNDAHAIASARLRLAFADVDQTSLPCIQKRALELLQTHTREMEEKYGEQTTAIRKRLFALQDKAYQAFQCKLIPTVSPETIIGVRTPLFRKLAKELAGTPQAESFLRDLPHKYHEENNLHASFVGRIDDYDTALAQTQRFLPYIDNWATCDGFCPKVFAKHKTELLVPIRQWLASNEIYTVRFAIGMLMRYYLEEEFRPEYLAWVAGVRSEEYYVNMMRAWYFATALAKQPDATLPWLTEQRLDVWTHNKTIQKAVESFRISEAMKQQLRRMRI